MPGWLGPGTGIAPHKSYKKILKKSTVDILFMVQIVY